MDTLPQVVQHAIAKATQLLDAAGCVWAIRTPNGEIMGVPDAFAPAERERQRDDGRRVRVNFQKLGYREVIDAMGLGDVKVFTAPSPELRDRYRQTLSSYAAKVWGNGNYMTSTRSPTEIELLCTGHKETP